MVFLGLVIPNVVKFKTVMVIESGQKLHRLTVKIRKLLMSMDV